MSISLSVYWVKFFKNAGFPQDVATKHAVVFSNNRIKPDMLPDLDKPSLKEMGITLMGDMIAILRYAKKVVEETTCEKFLVDTEDSNHTSKVLAKPVVKKIVTKTSSIKTPITVKSKSSLLNTTKLTKSLSVVAPKTLTVKKPASTSVVTVTDNKKNLVSLKRTLETEEGYNGINNDRWNVVIKKKLKSQSNDDNDNKVGYTVMLPKGISQRNQQINKKSAEQKRTVFDRLGDSSVTSTTNLAEASPTFNITGLGKDVYKRTISVFNRLGDKDAKKDDAPQIGILKNNATKVISQGILKNRSSTSIGSSGITTTKMISTGTMRADQEVNMKNISNNVNQIVRTTKKITFNENAPSSVRLKKPGIVSSKLASERLTSIPAKARLGVIRSSGNKQVTFNRITTVSHVKKADVFSRLGI